MKTTKYMIVALLMLLVAVGALGLRVVNTEKQGYIDSIYYMKLLDKTLAEANNMNITGKVLVYKMLSANVPRDIDQLHKEVYGYLNEYFEAVEKMSKGSIDDTVRKQLIAELNDISSNLPELINQYIAYLKKEAHDPAQADTLGVALALDKKKFFDETIPSLVNALLTQYNISFAKVVEIKPVKDLYRPGEKIEITVYDIGANMSSIKLYLMIWPNMIKASVLSLNKSNDTYHIVINIPPVDQVVRLLGSRGIHRIVKYMLLFRVRYIDQDKPQQYAKIISVEYDLPHAKIFVPHIAFLNDKLQIKIIADRTYSVSIGINNKELMNKIMIRPGENKLYLNINSSIAHEGVNNIFIDFNATDTTIPWTYYSAIIIKKHFPNIQIDLPRIYYTWNSVVQLKIVNKGNTKPIHIEVYAYGYKLSDTMLNNTLTASYPIGFLPVFPLKLKIIASANSSTAETGVIVYDTLVINPSVTLILTLILLPVAVLLHDKEKKLILSIQLFMRQRGKGFANKVVGRINEWITTSAYGITSRIADLYYGLIRRLRLPYPEKHETLREHFARCFVRNEILRKLLWRMITYVEKDLYSRNKPSYDEAEKIAEEVTTIEA